jgi:hypothetical protein
LPLKRYLSFLQNSLKPLFWVSVKFINLAFHPFSKSHKPEAITLFVCRELVVIDPEMLKVRRIREVAATPAI